MTKPTIKDANDFACAYGRDALTRNLVDSGLFDDDAPEDLTEYGRQLLEEKKERDRLNKKDADVNSVPKVVNPTSTQGINIMTENTKKAITKEQILNITQEDLKEIFREDLENPNSCFSTENYPERLRKYIDEEPF